MKNSALIALSCVMLIVNFSCKKEESQTTMTAQTVIGNATVINESGKKTLKTGDMVGLKDTVMTGDNSIVDLLYGNSGIIRLGENSKLNVRALTGDKSDDTNFYLGKGKLHVTIAKITKGAFTVNTPTMVAAVRGTSFRVVVDDDTARLDVLKGTVKMNPVVEGKVAEELTTTVEMKQTVQVDEKIAAAAVQDRKEITATELEAKEIREIVDEVKDIPEPVVEKLNDDVKRELKQDVIQLPQAVEQQKEQEREEKAQQAEAQRRKQLADRRKRQEEAQARKQEQDRLAAQKNREDDEKARQTQLKAQQEQQKKEKQKRDRASNIPTL